MFLTWASGIGRRERRLLLQQPTETVDAVQIAAGGVFDAASDKEPPPVFIAAADANGMIAVICLLRMAQLCMHCCHVVL